MKIKFDIHLEFDLPENSDSIGFVSTFEKYFNEFISDIDPNAKMPPLNPTILN